MSGMRNLANLSLYAGLDSKVDAFSGRIPFQHLTLEHKIVEILDMRSLFSLGMNVTMTYRDTSFFALTGTRTKTNLAPCENTRNFNSTTLIPNYWQNLLR